MIRVLIVVLVSLFCLNGYSQQDTVLFMNGVILPCKIITDDGTDLIYEFQKRKKLKRKSTHKSDIFGIIQNGERKVYYHVHAIAGDDLSEEQVLIFMAGQRDARNNFNLNTTWIAGLSFGTIAGILSRSNFLLVAVPVIVYPAAQLIPVIKIKKKFISDENYRYNDIYAEGFERAARGKKIAAAVKSSAIGTAVGTIIYRVFLR